MKRLEHDIARSVILEQFPEFENLKIEYVLKNGHDNTTFRLGDKLSLRFPNAKEYEHSILNERIFLPILQKSISCKIPNQLYLGTPSNLFSLHFGIYEWIEGESANLTDVKNKEIFAKDLAIFLNQLHSVDITNAPLPSEKNFYRGGDLKIYEEEFLATLPILQNYFDIKKLTDIWYNARNAICDKRVWIHGDLSVGNILTKQDTLEAIIDFGQMAVGDPSCDLAIYFSGFFNKQQQDIFKQNLNLSQEYFIKAMGWALWKASINFKQNIQNSTNIINEILKFEL